MDIDMKQERLIIIREINYFNPRLRDEKFEMISQGSSISLKNWNRTFIYTDCEIILTDNHIIAYV